MAQICFQELDYITGEDRGEFIPRKSHPSDAGFDLKTIINLHLAPGERMTVPTGVAIALPEGYAANVVPRSGHAARHGISVVNSPGLIDSGYRGEVKVILINLGQEPVTFQRGDRIAQLAVWQVPDLDVQVVDELPSGERGDAGFGSTGSQ